MNHSVRTLKRRKFLKVAAAAAAGGAVGCGGPRSPWRFLSPPEAETLAALCDQIIPPDDYPGAAQAGVVVFIDRQLIGHYNEFQQVYRQGLRAVEERSATLHGKPFTALSFGEQTELAAALEKDEEQRPFFNLVLTHTMQGYYGSPRHGGNRHAVSWKMLGVPDPPVRGRQHYDVSAKS